SACPLYRGRQRIPGSRRKGSICASSPVDLCFGEGCRRTPKDRERQDLPVTAANVAMSTLGEIEQGIESLLMQRPYGVDPQQRHIALLALLKKELAYACDRNSRFRNYVEHWPIDFRGADKIADLPYLPVGVFKANPPLALVGAHDVKRTLTSSATTGQVPSRVALDAATARRMAKSVITIVRDFIGPARRPYLVVDVPENLAARTELGARGAAIQGLGSFATEIVSCLLPGQDGGSSL